MAIPRLFSILLVVIYLTGLDGQNPQIIPCVKPTTGPQLPGTSPKLPDLPNQFQTIVEANIVQKNYTKIVKEIYDYTNNRGMIESYNRTTGHRVRTVIDYKHKKAWTIDETAKTCKFMSTNSSSGISNFFGGKDGHIKGVKAMMYFGDDMGEKYVDGDKKVRGIHVHHWTSCFKMPQADGQFTMDYYFSKTQDYQMFGHNKSVPVRLILNGTANGYHRNGTLSKEQHSFYHMYEFADFYPGIHDVDLFQIPVGIHCDTPVYEKPLPNLPHQFSTGLEIIDENQRSPVINQQLYFDNVSQIVRVDSTVPMRTREAPSVQSITVIYDNKTGLMYTIDPWELNCTTYSTTEPTKTKDIPFMNLLPLFVDQIINGSFTGNYIYQGKKTWRGMTVESWSQYDKPTSAVTELFFKMEYKDNIPRRDTTPLLPIGGPIPEMVIPFFKLVGIYSSNQDMSSRMKPAKYMHFYGFDVGHPRPDVFDVSACYDLGHHNSYMAFKTEGNYKTDVLYYKREFIAALRTAIGTGAGVSITRVSSILVEQDSSDEHQLRVYFKLLDNKLSGLDQQLTGPSLQKAKLNLQDSVSKGLNFNVQYPTIEQNFEVKTDTLWETMSSQTQSQSSHIEVQKYSSGAMAGLGIGMIFIGAIVGLLVAFGIYKKVDTSVPYKVTD